MSLYLDVVRIFAALLVVLVHLRAPSVEGAWFSFPSVGFSAVMLFFVMSGFVMAHVVQEREHGLAEFVIARLARLWSVLVPALILTLLLDAIGRPLFPGPYTGWYETMAWDAPVARFVAAVLFLNQAWFFSIATFSNSPVWSLGFEFPYYLLFGIATFVHGRRRPWLLGAVLLVFGPKVLLLMPAWWFGVMAYRALLRPRHQVSEAMGWALFLGSLLALAAAFQGGLEWWLLELQTAWLGHAIMHRLGFANEFVWALFCGGLVALNFVGFRAIGHRADAVLAAMAPVIRFAASMTLSIYLAHMPIMLLAAGMLGDLPPGPLRTAGTLLLTLAGSVAFGLVFERQRFPLRRALTRAWARLQPSPAGMRP